MGRLGVGTARLSRHSARLGCQSLPHDPRGRGQGEGRREGEEEEEEEDGLFKADERGRKEGGRTRGWAFTQDCMPQRSSGCLLAVP